MRLRYLFIIRGDFVHCFDGLERHEGKVALASHNMLHSSPKVEVAVASQAADRTATMLRTRQKKWKMCTKDEGAVRQKK